MNNTREQGLELYREVYGEDMAKGIADYVAAGDGFGVKQAEWTLDFSFGSVWARTGIERKMRSCVVLGILIALRATDEIKSHTRMGLANGLTREEFEEIFYTAIPYAGFPAANLAKTAMLSVFAEIDAEQSREGK